MSDEAADFSGQVAVIRQNGTCVGKVCWHTPQYWASLMVPAAHNPKIVVLRKVAYGDHFTIEDRGFCT